MYLKNIKLINFRNYSNIDLNLNSKINIIYGNNAQGKTNLLESIYFLALTKSHRSLNDASLIKEGENNSIISCNCIINGIDKNLEIDLSNNKIYKIDNKKIYNLSEYVSNLKVIIFFPEDLNLIKSSPDVRRRYINQEISQIDKNYFKTLNEFNKILKIRNELLKTYLKTSKLDINYFDIITKYLIDRSSYIYVMRNRYINKLNLYIPEIYKNISGYDSFSIKYITNTALNLDSRDEIIKSLEKKYFDIKNVEMKVGTTLIGPHRDDIEFLLNEKNMKMYGSQGQQRMAVLSLKLSEISIFKKYTNDNPILLLDDVFSELDDIKKNNLLKYIEDNIQTIITTTDLNNISKEIIENSTIIHIVDGKIER